MTMTVDGDPILCLGVIIWPVGISFLALGMVLVDENWQSAHRGGLKQAEDPTQGP